MNIRVPKRILRAGLNLLILASFATLLACAAGKGSTYVVPGLSEGEGVLLESDDKSTFIKLNDAAIGEQSRLYVKAGENKLEIRYLFPRRGNPNWPLVKESVVTLNAETGKSYKVNGGSSGTGRLYIWLEDASSGQVVAGRIPAEVSHSKKPRGNRTIIEIMDIEVDSEEEATDKNAPKAKKRYSNGQRKKQRVAPK